MIATAVDHHGADSVRQMGEAILERQTAAVVKRVALGRTVEADDQHRIRYFELEQRGWIRGCGGGGVSMELLCPVVIVIYYN
jgi:hypothetical protein